MSTSSSRMAICCSEVTREATVDAFCILASARAVRRSRSEAPGSARQTARCGSKRWNPTDSAASRSQTDGRRNQANDAREEIGVLRLGLRSREEVPICHERLVELL